MPERKSRLTFDPEKHEYFWDGVKVPNVTSILKDAGLVVFHCSLAVLEKARNFGKAVHRVAQLWDLKDLDMKTVAKPLLPYLEGWKKFRAECKPRIERIEYRVYSKKYRYAGTLDRVFVIKFREIGDIKTDQDPGPTGPQTAGYQGAYNEMHPKERVTKRNTIVLKPGGYDIIPHEDRTDFSTFLAALQLVNYKEKHNIGREQYGSK